MAAAQSGRREPAPAQLRLVQEFVNTNDIDDGVDRIATPAALRQWLAERSVLGPRTRISAREHSEAIEVREALRALMAANNGAPGDPAAADILTRVASHVRPELRFDQGGRQSDLRASSRGVAGALGQMLIAVHEAMHDGTWPRMKACSDPRCRWAFYDHSRNASGRWCSMAVCGTRAKIEAAAARARRSRSSD